MELDKDLYSLINQINSCISQSNGSMISNCRTGSTDNIVLQIEKLNDLLAQTKVVELCDPDSPTNDSSGQHKFLCESSHLHIILLGYFYPVLVSMCLMGNFANIVIYNRKILRKSATVELLMIKAVMNMLFMTCLLPKHMVWFMNTGSIAFVNLEKILWSSWPYFLYVANVAGSSSTWAKINMD
uniref:G-protein coupled receptors family 1 profile domain-containing protein n=1 Tax=Romanomermis culicivorax TaxID=13658 RepID=A0A915K2F3_ROMCU